MLANLSAPRSTSGQQRYTEVTPRGTRCVRDLMMPSPVTVTPQTAVAEAHTRMQRRRIRHLPVLENGCLVGLISDRDIRLVLPSPATSLSVWELKYLLAQLTIGEVMTRFVVAVPPTCPVPEAVDLMLRHKIGALPVLEQRQLVGILTRTDILRAFYRVHNDIVALSEMSAAHG
jgi:acetoin utilization protein AcuB